MPLGMMYPEPDYQAEDDLRTLKRAEEIKADTGRMARAKAAAEKLAAAVGGDPGAAEQLREGYRKLS